MDDAGEVVAEQRIENEQFDDEGEANAGSKAGLEATGNYSTIYEPRSDHLEVHVTDPRQAERSIRPG